MQASPYSNDVVGALLTAGCPVQLITIVDEPYSLAPMIELLNGKRLEWQSQTTHLQ